MSVTIGGSRRKTSRELEALWREYKRTGDSRIRDRLVMSLSPLVRYIVAKKLREVPAHLEADDFISCGLVAVLGAIDRWDPAGGATLEQHVWTRVHGAIIDELRGHDWAPRSLRRWQREMGRAGENFVRVHGRSPTKPELATALEMTERQLTDRLDDLARAEIDSLNVDVTGESQHPIQRIDTLQSGDADLDPALSAERAEGLERMRTAFAKLSERQQQIINMLYRDELTLREIGERLGLTESRVCQLHGQIKRHLRGELAQQAELYAV